MHDVGFIGTFMFKYILCFNQICSISCCFIHPQLSLLQFSPQTIILRHVYVYVKLCPTQEKSRGLIWWYPIISIFLQIIYLCFVVEYSSIVSIHYIFFQIFNADEPTGFNFIVVSGTIVNMVEYLSL